MLFFLLELALHQQMNILSAIVYLAGSRRNIHRRLSSVNNEHIGNALYVISHWKSCFFSLLAVAKIATAIKRTQQRRRRKRSFDVPMPMSIFQPVMPKHRRNANKHFCLCDFCAMRMFILFRSLQKGMNTKTHIFYSSNIRKSIKKEFVGHTRRISHIFAIEHRVFVESVVNSIRSLTLWLHAITSRTIKEKVIARSCCGWFCATGAHTSCWFVLNTRRIYYVLVCVLLSRNTTCILTLILLQSLFECASSATWNTRTRGVRILFVILML